MNDDQGFEPEIVVLYCQHCARRGADFKVAACPTSGFSVRPVMLPCSSKIEVPYILKILESGVDGVEVIACPAEGCRFLVGSLRAEKRVTRVRGLLDEVHVGGERVGISRGPGLAAQGLLALVASRVEAVKALGPNPMKQNTLEKGDVR